MLAAAVGLSGCSSGASSSDAASTSVASTEATRPLAKSVTPTTVTTSVAGAPSTRTPRPARPYDATLRRTIESLDAMWSTVLPEVYDEPYEPLAGGVFAYRSDTVIPACGGIRYPYRMVQDNAFYCPDEDLVAWDDEGLFPDLADAHGELILAIVLAHEWGHAIQQRVDALSWVDTLTSEQQADCFAGAWLGQLDAVKDPELVALRDSQLDAALAGFVEFRDLVGFAGPVLGSHGTAFDRIRALQQGVTEGAAACATYTDVDLPLVGFSYRNLTELWRGGDVDLDTSISTTVTELERFAAASGSGPEVVVGGRRNLFCAEPSDPFGSTFSLAVDICLDGRGAVSWSTLRLTDTYERFGDFAPATLIALGWSAVAVQQETPDATPLELQISSACLTGRWAGTLIDLDDPKASLLSPGDLDEAVQVLLSVAGDSGGPADGFSLVAAFRSGVLEGTCG